MGKMHSVVTPLINNDTHQRETLTERPIRLPLKTDRSVSEGSVARK